MKVQGSDCSILIKTAGREFDVPFAEETIREAVSVLYEEAAIEGDGVCGALRKSAGVTGCVVTPLTFEAAPLLLYLAMGGAAGRRLQLAPMEDAPLFDLIQERGTQRRLFEACGVAGFELRVSRDEALKLKLDLCGFRPPVVFPLDRADSCAAEGSEDFSQGNERYSGGGVTYTINGREYKNIYALTIIARKRAGARAEVWLMRVLEKGNDLPELIEELVITAALLKGGQELNACGMFRITAARLVFVSDETNVNAPDSVVGPLRFYVSGSLHTEVFSVGGGAGL